MSQLILKSADELRVRTVAARQSVVLAVMDEAAAAGKLAVKVDDNLVSAQLAEALTKEGYTVVRDADLAGSFTLISWKHP